MKFNGLIKLKIQFENLENITILPKAIDFIDFSSIKRELSVNVDYVLERNVADYIVIELNQELFNTDSLMLDNMYIKSDENLEDAKDRMFEHFRHFQDIVSLELFIENRDPIEIHVPWSGKSMLNNPNMDFIEEKNISTILFDKTLRKES